MSVAGEGVEPIYYYLNGGNENTPLLPSHQAQLHGNARTRAQNGLPNRQAHSLIVFDTRCHHSHLPKDSSPQNENPENNHIFYWVFAFLIFIGFSGFYPSLSSILQRFEPLSPGEERDMYRSSGAYWGVAQPYYCLEAYHNREYIAQLQNFTHYKGYDMGRACRFLEIKIQNRTYESPNACRQQGQNMYGYWTVYDQQDCTIDDEIQKYRNSGMSWDTPLPGPHCQSYDKREYKAELINIPRGFDWNKACRYIPVTIQDQTIEQPDVCERQESRQYGKWLVNNQLACRPYWGPLRDVGCQASGKERFEAELWNLIEGDDWYGMCASTPARWHGKDYEHPTSCDYRKRGGMIGIWDVEIEDCSSLENQLEERARDN